MFFLALCAFGLLAGGQAEAAPVSIELTSDGLGLGSSDINRGGTVDADVLGKIVTSPTTGEGSILTIQTDGLAGSGTALDPLLVTVTAKTHLDTLFGLPASHDYLAGVIFISRRSGTANKDGLGVRAFEVDGPTGMRLYDTGSGMAVLGDPLIAGSKDVSGGTGPDTYDSVSPNGSPHVDEGVTFDFNASLDVSASSVEVLLSKYDPTDIMDLHIELTSGGSFDFIFLETTHAGLTEVSDKLWTLNFGDLGIFGAGDNVASFTIRANDDLPAAPKGTAEHFRINGLSLDATTAVAIPEPGTMTLIGGGLLLIAGRLRKRKNRTR